MTYSILTEGLSTQVIILTATAGGVVGFTLSWVSVGASLVSPPLLISVLLLRSLTQQVLHQREYSNFKRISRCSSKSNLRFKLTPTYFNEWCILRFKSTNFNFSFILASVESDKFQKDILKVEF